MTIMPFLIFANMEPNLEGWISSTLGIRRFSFIPKYPLPAYKYRCFVVQDHGFDTRISGKKIFLEFLVLEFMDLIFFLLSYCFSYPLYFSGKSVAIFVFIESITDTEHRKLPFTSGLGITKVKVLLICVFACLHMYK